MTSASTHLRIDPQHPQPVDLVEVLVRLGATNPIAGEMAPEERKAVDVDVQLVAGDAARSLDGVAPAPVQCYIDGIQSQLVVRYISGRPIHLTWVAAGAMADQTSPVGALEALRFVCSEADKPFVLDAAGTVNVETIDDAAPPYLAGAITRHVAKQREGLERSLASQYFNGTPSDAGLIVCDGSIIARNRSDRVVGVVKTHGTRYLSDESELWKLPEGWRSTRFLIGEGETMDTAGGHGQSRYSCYLRLWGNRAKRWDHGLVRLEANDVDVLDTLAARCLTVRQDPGAGDHRWDRHLLPVAACERFLRSRRPALFDQFT